MLGQRKVNAYPPLPKKIKGIDSFEYVEKIRPLLLKYGWKLDIDPYSHESPLYFKETPEAICGAPSCQYNYIDKNENHLSIFVGDFVYKISLTCKKSN